MQTWNQIQESGSTRDMVEYGQEMGLRAAAARRANPDAEAELAAATEAMERAWEHLRKTKERSPNRDDRRDAYRRSMAARVIWSRVHEAREARELARKAGA